jgi:hypothetical protein
VPELPFLGGRRRCRPEITVDDFRARLQKHAVPFLAALLNCTSDEAWKAPVCFQIFTDTKPKPSPDPLAQSLFGSLEECAEELGRLNGLGGGIYFSVNATKGRKRGKAHIVALRGWHTDLDFKDATSPTDDQAIARAMPLQPTLSVRTPGGRHEYWLTEAPVPCLAETQISTMLASIAGAGMLTALAVGTMVDRPTLALIGEAGPEIVAPQHDFNDWAHANQNLGYNLASHAARISGLQVQAGSYGPAAAEQAGHSFGGTSQDFRGSLIVTKDHREFQDMVADALLARGRRRG